MNKRQGYASNTDREKAYVEGNTVRKLNAAPERIPEHKIPEREKKRKLDRAAKANRERAMQMNPAYLLFLTFAVIVTVAVCAAYIYLQSDINSRMKHIAALENELLNIKADNDAAWKRIQTSVDLEAVKNVAINELGMVHPKPEQIVYFEIDTNDYMNQYQDIPEK